MTSKISSSSSSSSSDDEIEKLIEKSIEAKIKYVNENHHSTVFNSRARGYTRRFIERDRELGDRRLWKDYFAPNAVYPDNIFRRRFRMRKHVFHRVVDAITERDPFFQQRRDATGRLGMSSLQKCTASLRMLAYGEASDRVDEYLRLGESTTKVSFDRFIEAVVEEFGAKYMRAPTTLDLQKILQINEARGFPGMIGSLDCMHWQWKNCLTAWKGQYQGRSGRATVILEAVATQDLWIWHSFFGVPGSCNDLNVLHRSPLFDDVFNERAPHVDFVINGRHYDTTYYLTDEIYPKWATFISGITSPQTPKDTHFTESQESARKDVERAFGVLQARFAIIRKPALTWDRRTLDKIMKTCIILHNMIIEDERDSYVNYMDPAEYAEESSQSSVEESEYTREHIVDINLYVENRARLEDRSVHNSLKSDLIEHLWQKKQDDANRSHYGN